MDSGFSKHTTRSNDYFISLKTLQGGGFSFGNGKKGFIHGVGKIAKSPDQAIKDVYYVDGLKYNLWSVSQICDKGNEVKFSSDGCMVSTLKYSRVILKAKRIKNMYVANIESVDDGELTCLSFQSEDVDLWHRRLGHVSFLSRTSWFQKNWFMACQS